MNVRIWCPCRGQTSFGSSLSVAYRDAVLWFLLLGLHEGQIWSRTNEVANTMKAISMVWVIHVYSKPFSLRFSDFWALFKFRIQGGFIFKLGGGSTNDYTMWHRDSQHCAITAEDLAAVPRSVVYSHCIGAALIRCWAVNHFSIVASCIWGCYPF